MGDPDGRAAHIACGAALAQRAGGRRGRRACGRISGCYPTRVNHCCWPRYGWAGGITRRGGSSELHAAIWRRQTNREPFSNRPVPPGVRAELAEAACLEGAMLAFPDRDEAARVLRLAAEAERDLLADPAYRAELARWAGGYRDRDGIPGSALGPRSPKAAIRSANSPLNGARGRCGTPGSRSTRNWPCCRPAATVRWSGWRRPGPAAGLADRHLPRHLGMPADPAAGNGRGMAGSRSAVGGRAAADDPADWLWPAAAARSAQAPGGRGHRPAAHPGRPGLLTQALPPEMTWEVD